MLNITISESLKREWIKLWISSLIFIILTLSISFGFLEWLDYKFGSIIGTIITGIFGLALLISGLSMIFTAIKIRFIKNERENKLLMTLKEFFEKRGVKF